ncbi:MAG: isoleucyl-tRNA synthetase [Bacteroidota bacterium]
MLKVLKLQKAVYVIILGILTLVVAQIMSENKANGSNFVLGVSGAFLIIGALMFLYPILFAKKVDTEEESVELKPVGKEIDGE